MKYLDPKAVLTFKKIFGKHPEEVEITAFTEDELRAYDKFWDMVRTEKTLQVDSFDEGMAKGRAEGRAEGELTKSLDIARKMLASGLPASQVMEFTGLSKEQLDQLK